MLSHNIIVRSETICYISEKIPLNYNVQQIISFATMYFAYSEYKAKELYFREHQEIIFVLIHNI
jgi:hypothetical protein